MNMKTLLSAVILVPGLLMAAPKSSKAPSALTPGSYTASVKAIPCEGCAGLIEETLKANPAIENIAVDTQKKSVTFQVKKNASVNLAELQKSLKTAADQMGMGADYRLDNLKKS